MAKVTANGHIGQDEQPWLLSRERIPVNSFQDSSQASNAVAAEIAALVRETGQQGESRRSCLQQLCSQGPKSWPCQGVYYLYTGRRCVLGLATGSTPMNVYRELIREHKAGLSFSHVTTFNLVTPRKRLPNRRRLLARSPSPASH